MTNKKLVTTNNATEKDAFPLPIKGFLDLLKGQGFVVGIDQHIRMQAVFRMLDKDCYPNDIKYLMCPIFAASPKQQRQFYSAFDRYFSFLELPEKKVESETAAEKMPDETPEPPPLFFRKWIYALILFLMLSGVAISVYLGKDKPVEPEKTDKQTETSPAVPGNQTSQTPIKENITLYLKGSPPKEPTFYQKYGQTIRWTGFVTPLLLFLITELYRRRHIQLIIDRKHKRKPPYVFPIEIDPIEPAFVKSRRFYTTAHFLRQRIRCGEYQIDIDRTIEKSLDKAGFADDFAYKPVTRPPEYLVFIDLPAYRDHHAHLFNTLVNALENEDIFITKFFYKEDPQICFREMNGKREYLSDIASKYSNHRLLIFGDGEGLIHPGTGDADRWTSVFHHWREKAILTPIPVKDWGMREITLSNEFIILPAALEALGALNEYFDGPLEPDLGKVIKIGDSLQEMDEESIDNLETLKNRLGSDVFLWLCACAVYPELHWNLTLYLGIRLGYETSEENLYKLIRLPWFKEGVIPDSIRRELIGYLDDKQLDVIRNALFEMLKNNEPPEDSAAWDQYRLYLAIYDVKRDWKKRLREIKKRFKNIDPEDIKQDYTLLRILETRSASKLIIRLPDYLRKVFFKNGMPIFGVRTRIRLGAAILLSLLVLLFVNPPPFERQPSQTEKPVVMKFAYIPPGEFMMGSPEGSGFDNEKPQHKVMISEGFYMQTTEVTQGQWKTVMGENPSYFKDCGDDCPVEAVSWNDIQEFIKKLNEMEVTDKYRLPSEAEWEYACRAGSESAYCYGDDTSLLSEYAWYDKNSDGKTHPAGQLKPNEWGLYDMHGNVWEWTSTIWGKDFQKPDFVYPYDPNDGREDLNTDENHYRVLRGGSVDFAGYLVRCACRYGNDPVSWRWDYGFRVLFSPNFTSGL